jgi:hypothetical protein
MAPLLCACLSRSQLTVPKHLMSDQFRNPGFEPMLGFCCLDKSCRATARALRTIASPKLGAAATCALRCSHCCCRRARPQAATQSHCRRHRQPIGQNHRKRSASHSGRAPQALRRRDLFGFSQSHEFPSLDGWIRRRLRCVAWIQWKYAGPTLSRTPSPQCPRTLGQCGHLQPKETLAD